MFMHNLPHPGEIIRELCLEPLGVPITEAVEALGVSRKTLSSMLNGKTASQAYRANPAFQSVNENEVGI
jgi:addiction module HigA family antidote